MNQKLKVLQIHPDLAITIMTAILIKVQVLKFFCIYVIRTNLII